MATKHSDRPHPLRKAGASLRSSASTDSMPAVRPGDDQSVLARIERRQTDVIAAVGEALETMGVVVEELQASVDEDGRMRSEVRELTRGVRGLRTTLRVSVYASVCLVAVAVAAVVYASVEQVALAEGTAARAVRMLGRVETVDANSGRTLRVVLKQAEALAKRVEAETAPTPSATHEAAVAAVEAQEEAAATSIEVARERRERPPPEAEAALREARAKKARLNGVH